MTQRLNFGTADADLYKKVVALDTHIAATLGAHLFDLVKLRASMINGCAYCLDMHSAALLKDGETPARLFGLAAWWETDLYTPRERAALALTDAVTRLGEHGVPDDVYAAARDELDDQELTNLVAAIGVINLWNRLAITFQLTPASVASA